MREKLIELLSQDTCPQETCGPWCEYWKSKHCNIESLADYLLANDVTVQEWIPAVEPPKESGEYIVLIHGAAKPTTLLYDADLKSWFEAVLQGDEEIYTYYPVDYWMPLPEVPDDR